LKLNAFLVLTSPIYIFVSFKITKVKRTAIEDTIPAIIKGRAALIPTVNEAIAGPKTKPNPKDAPRIANPFPLFFSSVVSEMIAEITGMLPAVIPSRALAINKNIALGAKAIMKKEIAEPIKEIARSGFLPYLSDNLPIIGVAISWQSENKENKSPF